MSADRQEQQIDDAAAELDRGAQEMEQHRDELEQHIDDAKATAAQRQDAPEQNDAERQIEDAAGDWEGEATGSSQGEDAEDAT